MNRNEEHLKAAKQKLLDTALNYARAASLGYAITANGACMRWQSVDQKMWEEVYLKELQLASLSLLTEVTCVDIGLMP